MPRKAKETWGDAVGSAPWAQHIPPAPGDLRIVHAMVNTVDPVTGVDELGSLAALRVDGIALLAEEGLRHGERDPVGEEPEDRHAEDARAPRPGLRLRAARAQKSTESSTNRLRGRAYIFSA